MTTLDEEQRQIMSTINRFVEREVKPVASEMEHRDEYPHALVERMKELGLFGAIIPTEYGGLGLSFTTYAMIIEEICRGWMSLTGILNSHLLFAHILVLFGTEEQKQQLLPAMANGGKRGGLALTEPHAGSDVQSIRTTAKKHGDHYLINGSKMFITNARHGNILAVAVKTNPEADPAYTGISLFAVEKGAPGLTVSRDIKKLGYKGLDTCELAFEDFPTPASSLIGGEEGRGFKQVMGGLEVGRINVAARALGRSEWPKPHLKKPSATPSSARPLANRFVSIRLFRSSWPTWRRKSKPPASSSTRPQTRKIRGNAAISKPGWPNCLRRKRAKKSRSKPCASWVAMATPKSFQSSAFIGMHRL